MPLELPYTDVLLISGFNVQYLDLSAAHAPQNISDLQQLFFSSRSLLSTDKLLLMVP